MDSLSFAHHQNLPALWHIVLLIELSQEMNRNPWHGTLHLDWQSCWSVFLIKVVHWLALCDIGDTESINFELYLTGVHPINQHSSKMSSLVVMQVVFVGTFLFGCDPLSTLVTPLCYSVFHFDMCTLHLFSMKTWNSLLCCHCLWVVCGAVFFHKRLTPVDVLCWTNPVEQWSPYIKSCWTINHYYVGWLFILSQFQVLVTSSFPFC